MKTILPSICLLLYCSSSIAQRSAAYDARFLRTLAESDPTGKFKLIPAVRTVLEPYFKPGLNDAQLTLLIQANPFLNQVFQGPGLQAVPTGLSVPGALGSSIGSLDVTNLADGLAKFLVKRAEEELSVAFFNSFADKLKNSPEAQALFPQTSATLEAIGTEIYNYTAFLQALRESFEKDLSDLLPNLSKVISTHTDFLAGHPGLRAACLSSLYVGTQLLNKSQPGDIIANYDLTNLIDTRTGLPVNQAFYGSIQTLQLLSESMRSNSGKSYWLSADSIMILINDPEALTIYLGLIYQKVDGIKFSSTITLQSELDQFKPLLTDSARSYFITQYGNYLRQLSSKIGIVTSAIATLSGKAQDKVTFADYYSLYNGTLDLLGLTSSLYELPGLDNLKPIMQSSDFQSYISDARTAGNIALDVSRRNYSSAIINCYNLYNVTLNGENDASGKPRNSSYMNFVLKYGSFMATITQAQNSDEVEDAIEAVVLPPGSSSIKRLTEFNVALNAYVGLYGGIEHTKGLADAFTAGLTAPIGLDFSWGDSGSSNSFFISIFDLGAIAALRFTNDSVSQIPEVQLKDIVSLGLFYSHGFEGCPISVNLGLQIGPNLRSVSDAKNDYSGNLYTRASLGICVDIPLFDFYTRGNP